MKSQLLMRAGLFFSAFLLSVNSALFCAPEPKVLKHPTFELLSGKYDEYNHKWRTFSVKDQLDLKMLARNYDRNIGLLDLANRNEPKIPHVIHFIWIGPRAFPAKSVANVLSWKKHHPGWEINFWTDSPDRPCPAPGMKRRLITEINYKQLFPYLSRTNNPAEMADIIRNELIYEFGGVYVDHDVTCFQPFDKLHAAFDFYVGLENPHVNEAQDTKVFPCNCLFGARPGHPILKGTMDYIEKRWELIAKKYPKNNKEDNFNRVIGRTFHSFTLATKKYLSQDGNHDMVLPSSFFFAHKLFRKKTIEELKKVNYVFASHAFDFVWDGGDKEKKLDCLANLQQKQKQKQKQN